MLLILARKHHGKDMTCIKLRIGRPKSETD